MEKEIHYHNIIEKSKFVETNSQEILFRKTITRFFEEWKRQIILNLKKEYVENKNLKKALGDINFSSIVTLATNKIKAFINKLTAISLKVAQQGLERSYRDMGVTLSWNIDMTKLADFYKERYQTWFSEIIERTTQMDIMDDIAEGIRNGESIDQLSASIEEYFKHPITVPEVKDEQGNITRKEYQIDQDVYSEMVARSEVSGAVNNGRLYGYRESGLVKTVRWFANPGACEYCADEHGQVFDVGEAQDMIPAHPNCRCTWIAEEYGEYKEESDPTVFTQPEDIVANKDGVHIMEWFKMTPDQESKVNDLLDKERYQDAIDLMNQYMKGTK